MLTFIKANPVFKKKVHLWTPKTVARKNRGYIVLKKNHWTCFWKGQRECEYFDPLGKPAPLEIMTEFKTSCYRYLPEAVQGSTSTLCGQFCIFFLYFKIKRYDYNDILAKFDDFHYNDNLVKRFYLSKN